MENKTNQNKKAVLQTSQSSKLPTQKEQIAKESSEEANEAPASFPNSLNEELDELLKKNPRRFFGGCG
jgi:hypothetical protein